MTPSSPNSSDDEAASALTITNRCSPKSVFSLVSNLSEFKKQIVRDMGFGGIRKILSHCPAIELRTDPYSTFVLD